MNGPLPSSMRFPRPDLRGLAAALLAWALVATPATAQQSSADLGRKALAVLEANCYRCHGQNGSREGGMDYVLDSRKLVEKRKVVPKDAGKSRLLRRILAEEMPPEG